MLNCIFSAKILLFCLVVCIILNVTNILLQGKQWTPGVFNAFLSRTHRLMRIKGCLQIINIMRGADM